MDSDEDLGPAYMDHRIRLAQTSAADELLQRVGAQQARPKPSESPGMGAAPATTPGGIESLVRGEPQQQSMPTRIAKDVGKGLFVEPPRAIVRGLRGTVQNTINMGRELGGWLEEHNLGGGVIVDDQGIRFVSGKELSQADVVRPGDYDLPPMWWRSTEGTYDPTTVTGGLIKGVTQFLVGLAGVNKLAKVAGVPEMAGAAGYGLTLLPEIRYVIHFHGGI